MDQAMGDCVATGAESLPPRRAFLPRRIVSHRPAGVRHQSVPPTLDELIDITAVDPPGAGGAHHHYVVDLLPSYRLAQERFHIFFQCGPLIETGVNGISCEALLVVNFFRVLRERPAELFRQLRRTPYARAEFLESYEPCAEPLEQARRFFVRAWQGFAGPRKSRLTGWKIQKRQWPTRGNITGEWQAARYVAAAARRLQPVQIEHDEALAVIQRYDAPGTLFYVDPPYPTETRSHHWAHAYTCELPLDGHRELAAALRRIAGMAVVSTYPNEGYDALYAGWGKVSRTAQTMNNTIATEVLYLSPRAKHQERMQ